MKLQDHQLLDAVCGEYIVGTLRGRARHRFEVLLAREPRIALRLQELQGMVSPDLARLPPVQPSPEVWRKLSATLELDRYRTPWHRRPRFWQAWAWTATVALQRSSVFSCCGRMSRHPAVRPSRNSPARREWPASAHSCRPTDVN